MEDEEEAGAQSDLVFLTSSEFQTEIGLKFYTRFVSGCLQLQFRVCILDYLGGIAVSLS